MRGMKSPLGVALYVLTIAVQAVSHDTRLIDRSDVRDLRNASPTDQNIRRALPDSPKGYVPSYIDCPSTPPSVRTGGSVSPDEAEWLEKRREVATTSMREFLTRMNITDFDAGSYIDQHAGNVSALPNVALALSGGGWRALTIGAGAMEAFDNRTQNSTAQGHLGGLLQSATYIAGLSGGSWLVGSIYANNFTTVTASIDNSSGSIWEFGNSILQGPAINNNQTLGTLHYWTDIVDDVYGKSKAGFNTSITDLWGRALSYQLINAEAGGDSYTFSSIAMTKAFQDASQPFPIVVAESRSPGAPVNLLNSTMYEFNPFDMGSWDSSVDGFVPTRYLGTNMSAGKVTPGHQCVVGYDNFGFVMGTSSSLFNSIIFQSSKSTLPSIVKDLVVDILVDLGEADDDVANYNPNPFYGWNNATNPAAQSQLLTLVDGGEDNQTIPFYPLIQPARNVDVIFAVDSADDTSYYWPNGTSLVQTFKRSQEPIANGGRFPYVPDQNTIINLGLNTRPTFFGCTSNATHNGTDPLVVYIPNSPYTTYSNLSTLQLTTNDTQRDAMILNGYNMATMGNGTVDSTWSMCVGCAILARSFERTNTTVPTACSTCFTKFCWDGTLNTSEPNAYAPFPILGNEKLTSGSVSRGPLMTMGVACLSIMVVVMPIL